VFGQLLAKQDNHYRKSSGFILQCIDGLLLGVYKLTPLGGSFFIPLSNFTERKCGAINSQNVNQQYFNWAVLAKHLTGEMVCRVGDNYYKHENKYNFNGLEFPKCYIKLKNGWR